ncbi:MAG: hypothetical protein CMF59_17935 [Leptospiraceae bacterium]|nr:hypothetical protein [Leptospiraceae bacterium]
MPGACQMGGQWANPRVLRACWLIRKSVRWINGSVFFFLQREPGAGTFKIAIAAESVQATTNLRFLSSLQELA